MGILNKLFNSGDVIKQVGGVLDNLTTSKEEKLQAKKRNKTSCIRL